MEIPNSLEEMNLVSYSDDELRELLEAVEAREQKIIDKISDELSIQSKKGLDIYSYFGNRKLNKILNKYKNLLDGAAYIKDLINAEIIKREKYNEEMRYSGKSLAERNNMTEEEFIQAEEEKTLKLKDKTSK